MTSSRRASGQSPRRFTCVGHEHGGKVSFTHKHCCGRQFRANAIFCDATFERGKTRQKSSIFTRNNVKIIIYIFVQALYMTRNCAFYPFTKRRNKSALVTTCIKAAIKSCSHTSPLFVSLSFEANRRRERKLNK